MTGQKLSKIRESLGMTRKEFARTLEISRNSLQKYEESPRVKAYIALAAKALARGETPR